MDVLDDLLYKTPRQAARDRSAAHPLREARDAWRDAFYLVTGVRDGGYAPPEIRAQAVENAVARAKELDERTEAT